jgi:hypothetical protein
MERAKVQTVGFRKRALSPLSCPQRLTGLGNIAKYANSVAKGIPFAGEVVTGVGCITN